jgi:hypothetical protein
MRWNTFGRSAVFAALAGIGVVLWLVVVGPLLGLRWALALYLVGLTATAVAGLASPLSRGVGAAVIVGALGGCLAVAMPTLSALALGLAVLFGMVRSVFFYRQPPARGVAVEVVLIGGGLLFASFLAGSSLLSVVLAVWGFLLVQSVFFLVGGRAVRERAAPQRDPFDAAHERARALLDGLGI